MLLRRQCLPQENERYAETALLGAPEAAPLYLVCRPFVAYVVVRGRKGKRQSCRLIEVVESEGEGGQLPRYAAALK